MGNGPEFFQTVMGRQFFDGTMPNLVEAIERLARRGPRFIQLTNPDGTPRIANVEHIRTFTKKEDGLTTIWIGSWAYTVKDSVEEILKMLKARN